jgi:TRAP-type uncharacterized transport system fused permease subunit
MRGMREDELPKFDKLVKQVYLFIPIVILIAALFMGYSVIRAGTLATVAAAVVSWLTRFRMGPRGIVKAFELAGVMSIQIIAVCACAGIIVGVISLTGVGARFSNLLLGIADTASSSRCSSPCASRSCSAWACRPPRPMRSPPRWWRRASSTSACRC